MNSDELLTDGEVEAALRSLNLRFLPGPQPGSWVLPFMDPSTGTGDLLGVECGKGNPGFISVVLSLAKTGPDSRNCVLRALSLANGFLALAKFLVADEGTVHIRVVIPRMRSVFQPHMLNHAVQSVLGAAEFIRPILRACDKGSQTDIGEVFRRRVAEVTGGPPNLTPPKPFG